MDLCTTFSGHLWATGSWTCDFKKNVLVARFICSFYYIFLCRFVVSAGTMPCHTTLHDAAGKSLMFPVNLILICYVIFVAIMISSCHLG